MIPGEIIVQQGEIIINEGRQTLTLEVLNSDDRPIQVGSHFHFFETNPAMQFDRKKARGFRLDIPAGTSIRFAPGKTQVVNLVAFGGRKVIWGFTGRFNGPLEDYKCLQE